MDLYLEIAGNQIDGARDYQEDAFLTTYLDDEAGESKNSALVVMADGMGGHAAGNIASNLVVSTFNKRFTGEFGKQEVPAVLRACLDKANSALRDSIRETPALDGMGCTMVTAALSAGKCYWISVGDSHLYLVRDGQLVKQNEDHSYGGYLDRMKAQGLDVEPEPGLSRNMLMSAMTGDDVAEIDCPGTPIQLEAGDRVIVASDGLDSLSEHGILELCASASTPKKCVESLLKGVEAAAKPRQDNTTVIVVDVVKRSGQANHPPAETNTAADKEEEFEGFALPSGEDFEELLTGGSASPESLPQTEPAKSKKGMVAVISGLLLVAALGGGWYLWQQYLSGSGEDVAALSEPEVAPEPTPVAVPAPVPEPEVAPEPALEPEIAASEPEPEATAEPEPAPAPEPATPEVSEFRDRLNGGGQGPVMVRLPGGRFEMGGRSVPAELPRRQVEVGPFAMGKLEVSLGEYRTFARATGRRLPDKPRLMKSDAYPVVGITWEDAVGYTQWLSKQTGHSYRLPTEAEWEYAARAGSSLSYWWGTDAVGTGRAHCFDCGMDPTAPMSVGSFSPNPFGLHDTAGNVYEWVADCYAPTYNGAPTDGSAVDSPGCPQRAVRGGAYETPLAQLKSSSRTKRRSATPYEAVGFRVVRDL